MKPAGTLSTRHLCALAIGVLLATGACTSRDAGENTAQDAAPAVSAEPGAGLAEAVAGAHRSEANKARDAHRHPVETLTFFGIRPDMTVVELWPFGGWYTEILAPYLRDSGVYYAAAMDPETASPQELRYNEGLTTLLASNPDLYSNVRVTALAKGKSDIAPEGTADLVLSFRNVHNWVWADFDEEVYAAVFKALKPGGVFGVVEHRHADPSFEPAQPGQAYVGEQWLIGKIEAAGFRLEDRSDINNNPRDTKDHPRGVWTLPPNYALGDQDRAKYEAIGESDRFTLKFVKPADGAAPAAQ
jgi:predicted methyltransferase